MTPKEKAKELNLKMALSIATEFTYEGYFYSNSIHAKKCTIVAVNEIIDQCHNYREIDLGMSFEYWQKVKHEIEKL